MKNSSVPQTARIQVEQLYAMPFQLVSHHYPSHQLYIPQYLLWLTLSCYSHSPSTLVALLFCFSPSRCLFSAQNQRVPPGSTSFQHSPIKDHSAPLTHMVHYRVAISKSFPLLPGWTQTGDEATRAAFGYGWRRVWDLTASLIERIYPRMDLHRRKKGSNCEDSAEIQQLESLPIYSQAWHYSSICH